MERGANRGVLLNSARDGEFIKPFVPTCYSVQTLHKFNIF